jgi:diguanylate cyclase (GGDEF)-like protein
MNRAAERATILVVDDAPANVMLLGSGLMSDYDVIVATSGDEALSLASALKRPDLVLLDIQMPGMDGFEVCRRLKQDAWTRDIPVIFITARDAVEDETQGLDLGAVDYITKPLSMPIVRARVRTHVELKRNRDLLLSLTLLDGLTGIDNRRSFDEALDKAWRRAMREKSPLSLLLVDIDHFKAFNDRYGHLAGDDCLRRVAGALKSCIRRPGDLLARYGGEEFACLLPSTPLPGALVVGESMRLEVQELRLPHAASLAAECVTVSIGAATSLPLPGGSALALVESSDRALYAAKGGTRNSVVALGREAEVAGNLLPLSGQP